ncbi:MAG: RidA family protein [Pseudomonadota bacterium]|nr:RidA family protein [Pseudomonadota bacterium]
MSRGREVLQPPGWARPRGYANGIAASGRFVFVAGQIGWDETGKLVSDDFLAQSRQALSNIVTVLAQAGASPEHLVRLTWYVTDKREYLDSGRELGRVYRELIGAHYPTMTAVQVVALIEDGARVEIEATAVVPAPA